ncbi:MAG: hypothetical protein COA71_06525 [SAR86 cluster bacterium]|uniref:Uncharacterized protein n=1 Tax=SAR86 cluster bacterium TaxID=2030880 RepID=A0A2A5CFE1_9GAMM|nr:MAG: hypothetical protein COA71_06525 [SAR86 cluster bacterium]
MKALASKRQPVALLISLLISLVVTLIAPTTLAQEVNPEQVTTVVRNCALPEPFPCPVARIVDVTVEPSTIDPGQTASITWAAENPTNMRMIPDVGRVSARGTVQVTPSATTIYTLRSENGPNGEVVTQSVTLTVRGTQLAARVQETAESRAIPRMRDGKPDLQGVWTGGWWYIDGIGDRDGLPEIPTPKPGFEHLAVVDDPLAVGGGCGITSVPWFYGPVYHFQIVQTPELVVSMTERMHLHRIFEINKEHSADVLNGENLNFLGSSTASWDGDTLVVDTRGFNLKTHVGKKEAAYLGGYRHSSNLHMVERITRIDFETLEIETTLEDPELFEGPWRIVRHHELRPELSTVPEYICEQDEDFYDSMVEGLEEVPLPSWLEVDPIQ